MGQFAIVVSGVGGHGCSREVKDGEHVLGCQRPDCPDCIAREFVRRFKRNGVSDLRAELVHWPNLIPVDANGVVDEDARGDHDEYVAARYAVLDRQPSTVIDNLVTGVRAGSF